MWEILTDKFVYKCSMMAFTLAFTVVFRAYTACASVAMSTQRELYSYHEIVIKQFDLIMLVALMLVTVGLFWLMSILHTG